MCQGIIGVGNPSRRHPLGKQRLIVINARKKPVLSVFCSPSFGVLAHSS